MSIALYAFIFVGILEVLALLPPSWRFAKQAAPVLSILTAISGLGLLVVHFSFPTIILFSLSLYRSLNWWRVNADRMQPRYLRSAVTRTALLLLAMQAALLGAWWLCNWLDITVFFFWTLLITLQLFGVAALLVTTIWHLYKTKNPNLSDKTLASKLPSLTVAIPARNETQALERCLQDLVASDYPKLEIIVYDDCSPVRRTPEIIRSFAHDGVRFIAGEEIKEGWLAKNQAYQALLDASSGDIILFCGVDARFEPHSLRQLVQTMQQKGKSMISIIPRNQLPPQLFGRPLLVQPMRYAWEIALPRKLFRRPPVLSTCWIIQRKLITSAGGFAAVSRSIVPESYFARTAVIHDGYSFMQASRGMGISCDKEIEEQHNTATRTKYPQLHRRPELVALLTIGQLLLLVMPYVFVVFGIILPDMHLLLATSLTTAAMASLWYALIVRLTYRRILWLSFVVLPIAAIHDLAVLNYSMLKYEFSVVLWKDRNVCIPVMRAEPNMPMPSHHQHHKA